MLHFHFHCFFFLHTKGTAIRCGQAVLIFSTMLLRENIRDWHSGQRIGSEHAGLAVDELMVCPFGAAGDGVEKHMGAERAA